MKLYKLQRKFGQSIDQLFAVLYKKLLSKPTKIDFDGDCRFALITVNFSTTYFLKLMLLTLCEQNQLNKVTRIVIVDNDSRDGGPGFLARLQQEISCLHLIENSFFCTHARGLRKGVAFLKHIERTLPSNEQSNILMFCDTDIIFRNPETLNALTEVYATGKYHFAGELRYSDSRCPQAQASFLTVRRDVYSHRNIMPFVNHGSPAYWMQKSLWKAGFKLKDFRSNFGGYILHRGRSGVSAAGKYYPISSYAAENNHRPHYMGIEGGEGIWKRTEQQFSHLLKPENETELIEYLNQFLNQS